MPSRVRRSLVIAAAAATAVATAVGATAATRLSMGSGNLLANGDFEGTLAGWHGYDAALSLAADGVGGGQAARVQLTRGTSFSIYPSPMPVPATTAGAYAAAGWVRSDTPGRRVCFRMREWAGESLVGSTESCVTATRAWQPFPALSYRASAGHQLDLYAYEWRPTTGDSFEVDSLRLVRGTSTGTTTSATTTSATTTSATTTVATTTAATTTSPTTTASATAPASTSGTTATTPSGSGAPLTVTALDNAHIRLAWSPQAGAVGYRVTRGTTVLGTTAASTFTDSLLWPQTSYSYRVDALAADGAVLATLTGTGVTGPLPASGFQRPFPATSFWNTPIGSSPQISPLNAGLMSYFTSHLNYPNMPIHSYGVSVAEAHAADPAYAVPCTMYTCTLGAFGAFAIPATAVPDPGSDGHLAVVDPATGREWDMWQAVRSGSGWSASAGSAVSMLGDGVAPAGTASGDAANLPLLGGLIRPEEILQGRIDHALVFGIPGIASGPPVCPATHNAPTGTSDPNALREGMKLQLDPGLDVNALAIPAWEKAIARAMQVYGMYLRDNSGTLAVYAEDSASRGYDAWAKVGLSGNSVSLAGIPWSRFRVLAAPDWPNC